MDGALLAKLLWQKISLTACAGLILCTLTAAQGLGRYGGAHLREPVGATAFALGGANTASPDYLCSWWNPAALATLRRKVLTLGLGYRPLGRSEGYLSFEFPIPPRVGMGLSVLYRGILKIDELVDEQEYPLNDCSYSTYSFKIGLSYLIKRNIQIGANISILHQSLPTDFTDEGNIKYSSITEIGGIDIAGRYELNKKLAYGLVLKNILASFDWEFKDQYGGLSAIMNDTLPATLTLGQEYTGSLLEKPFIWTCDLAGYLFNGNFKPIAHKHLVINNGFEWQRWELLFIRAGIRDIILNRDLFAHSDRFKDHFSLAVSLGFLVDLSKALKGKDIKLNYAVSNDKVWAGLDQQLDFVLKF